MVTKVGNSNITQVCNNSPEAIVLRTGRKELFFSDRQAYSSVTL